MLRIISVGKNGGASDDPAGPHTLRVVAYDMRGPRFTETCSILEIPFSVQKVDTDEACNHYLFSWQAPR